MKKNGEQEILRQTQRMMRHPHFRFWAAFARTFPRGDVYLVGGAVRDFALRRETKDFDFVVRRVPANRLMAFLKKHGRVDLVGKRFGVLKFLPRGYTGEAIDIALPRTERMIRGGGGYKDFTVQSSATLPIEKDLERRDFTVNAIAVQILNQESGIMNHTMIDPFDGVQDIQKKRLRTVGKPGQRFKEDYSRMLRGVRFACQLGFTLERATWAAIRKNMHHVNRKRNGDDVVPRETIGREMIKAFIASPLRAMDLWDTSGAFRVVIPELLTMKRCPQPQQFHAEGDVWTHTRLALSHLWSPACRRRFPDVDVTNALAIFGILFHDLGKPTTLRTPTRHGTDRIRFDGHDVASAAMTSHIAERLHLSQFPKEDAQQHIDTETLTWLIRHHMLFNEEIIRAMRATTLEKYFLKDRARGKLFQALAWADMAASIPAHGKQDWKPLRILGRRLRIIDHMLARSHVQPIVSGTEIMKKLHLPSGPFIGKLLGVLREEQLRGRVRTKKQAWKFLEKKV